MPRRCPPSLRLPAALAVAWWLCAGQSVAAAEGADKVRLEGLHVIPAGEARAWIASQVRYVESAGVTPARADDLAFFLENAMRQQGYREATVDWKVEGEGAAARIVLTVSEGRSVQLGAIDVAGNAALKDAAVGELLTAATRKRLKRDPGESIPYVREDIERGRAKVASFYRLMGFRDASVEIEEQIRGSRVDLLVKVDEGRENRVGRITLPEAPVPSLAAAFESIRTEFEGKVYSGAVPGNLSSRVRAAAVEQGFYHAKIETGESEGGEREGVGLVDLAVNADWGAPVAISQVRVRGNEKVRTEFFERHFARLIARPYSPVAANEAVNELLQSGVFETVRTTVAPLGEGYALDLEVEEGSTRTLGVYAGFTNYEGSIGGFEFRHLNLFGSVRKLDSAIEFSMRGARGEVNYTDPWFLDSPIQFGGGLFAVNRDEEGYEKFKTGGRYEFSRRFGPEKRDSLSLFGEASYTDVHDAEIDPALLGDRHYFAHQLGLSLTRDRRDDPGKPRKGHFAQASLAAASSAIASEVEYLRATGRLGYYLPFGENTLRLGARAGLISPMGDTAAIPIDLRYFNGGPFSVRSFQERSLGPIDPTSGHPVGGDFYTVFNAEYEIPLAAVKGLSVVPFADAGNLIFDDSDAGLEDLRYALGLGLRYATPIGPIRAEYGYNPDQRPGEPQGTFHIGFGLGY